jgi:hypothetical protein
MWVTVALPHDTIGHARLHIADDGRVTITDLYLHAQDITAAILRKINIARVRGKVAVYELLNEDETCADTHPPLS